MVHQTVQVVTRVEEAASLGTRMTMLAEQDPVLNFEQLPEEQRQNLYRREYIAALELAYGVLPLNIERHLPDNQTIITINPNSMDRELYAGDLAEL